MNSSILLLISLALLGLASAAVFQHEVHRRENLKTKLGRQSWWKEHYVRKQIHGKFSNFKSVSQNIDDYIDLEYYINVTIGTPDQLFTVILETSDAEFIIPDISCKNCQNIRKFDSSKSSTYQKTDHYVDNDSDDGVYGQDFVRFGNPGSDQLVIPKAMFGQSYGSIMGGVVDGVMGLGFTAQNLDGIDPPIITAINSGILDQPIVTLFMRSKRSNSSSKNNGVITYGAVDRVNCDHSVIYEPLSNPNAFEVSVKNAALGSSQFSGNWSAYIDTGSSVLLGPQSIVEAFAKEVNAVYNFQYNLYTIYCQAKFSLNLTVGDTVYTLTEENMVTDFIGTTCIFGLSSLDSDMWILGDPWFKIVCNVLDYGNKRVGFAKVNP